MDFKDSIKQLSERASKLKDNLQTEEATKNALIMPFLQALGYDVFNPLEVMPEFTCDIGTKKGEKIDYAIFKDNEPIILIECKHWKQDLTLHDNQLLRYFHVSKAKFGVLTNGIIYRFYTDLSELNKMDEKPFLEVNILDLREAGIEELKKFHKSYFDVGTILSSASELKYTGELKSIIAREFTSPSPDFVRLFAKQVYDGLITAKVLETFTDLMKKSLNGYISDKITGSLKSAIENQEKSEEDADVNTDNKKATAKELPEGVVYMSDDGLIVTTQEEIEAFYIVRSILRPHISSERITYRDAHSYFAIFIDDNNRKTICRFYLDSATNKRITFLDENKKEIHNKISSLDDIYDYSEQLIDSAKKFL
jgi:hypothetical protein